MDTTVTLDRTLAEELIFFKLHRIRELVEQILTKWNESSAQSFLEKAKDGVLEEAENDAIELKQSLLEEKNFCLFYKKLKNKIQPDDDNFAIYERRQ